MRSLNISAFNLKGTRKAKAIPQVRDGKQGPWL
jgi:hypothetical protein